MHNFTSEQTPDLILWPLNMTPTEWRTRLIFLNPEVEKMWN